ncbi:MAG: anaerobic ribonucleoside-triphosphate reductase activating protein [Candidatus Shapirobacteria bacterium]|jgi:pyruvate formate lyase activating enzyme
MNIGGLEKFSLIDYPGKISAVIFTQGCNFRCPYCHNPELLSIRKGIINEESVLIFLEKRKKQLEAVVITGGEPTLQSDLIPFLTKIKQMGYLIKLDTNGSDPEIIKKITELNLVDYVAMDIKASLDKYSEVVGVKVNKENILKSINLLIQDNIDYEFRTTITQEQLNNFDIEEIGKLLKGSKKYVLQKYIYRENKKDLPKFTAFDDKKMIDFKIKIKPYFDEILIR